MISLRKRARTPSFGEDAVGQRVGPQNGGVDLSEVIKARRTALGWSQADLAREAGIDVRQIRRYEAGDSQPTLTAAKALADALDVSIDTLAGGISSEGITGLWWMAWRAASSPETLLVRIEIAHSGTGYLMAVAEDPASSPHFPGTWRATLTRSRDGSYMGYSLSMALAAIFLLEPRDAGWFGQWIRMPIGPKNIGHLALARDVQATETLMTDAVEGLR